MRNTSLTEVSPYPARKCVIPSYMWPSGESRQTYIYIEYMNNPFIQSCRGRSHQLQQRDVDRLADDLEEGLGPLQFQLWSAIQRLCRSHNPSSAYTDLDQREVRHRQQRWPSQEEDRDLHREVLRDVQAPAAHGRGGVGPGVQRGADVAGRVDARARPEAGS